VWQETIFENVSILFQPRGSFKIDDAAVFLTFGVRFVSFTEGTCQIRLRFKFLDADSFSGGIATIPIVPPNMSNWRTTIWNRTAAGTFARPGNELAIYCPTIQVLLSGVVGAGGTVDYTYQILVSYLAVG
jgi:hypothetical protein